MLGRALRLVAVVAAEAAAVAVLHGLGRVDGLAGPGADPAGWLRSATPEELVAGSLRLVALGCAWWLLVSTLLYVAARVANPQAGAGLGRLVLPAARRLVDRSLAVSMMASVTFGGGLAGVAAAGEPVEPPPATIAVRDGRAVEAAPPGPPATTPATTAPPVPDPPPAPAEPTPRVHVVAPGESLWTIAARHFPDATDAELARSWARVVEANRATLRSGNPDLIYPGEAVELPPRP